MAVLLEDMSALYWRRDGGRRHWRRARDGNLWGWHRQYFDRYCLVGWRRGHADSIEPTVLARPIESEPEIEKGIREMLLSRPSIGNVYAVQSQWSRPVDVCF